MLQNKTLEELKRLGKHQLETQLDMLEILLALPTIEKRDFENWYTSHPYYKGFKDVVDIVRRRAGETDGSITATSGDGNRPA
jgi:hypothetical protein